jgi:hypothetical protein
MLRPSVRLAVACVALFSVTMAPAWAAEEPAPAAPLPFLTVEPDCPAGPSTVTPTLPDFLSTGTTNICTGCSVHNCFYKAEGSRCTVNGQVGRCVAHNYCPEVRELSCGCEPL